jgi:hydroxyquinol 1,2-dioxygenase
MRNFTEANLTEAVLTTLERAKDPRFKQIMTSLIGQLHAFVRETGLTEAEWLAGIQFLTATGQKCDAERQEYILLSDTLGISMLVDAINHRKPTGASETTVLGPFYRPGAPSLPMWANIAESCPGSTALPTFVFGRVLDVDRNPIPGALLDVWQTDADGLYDVQRSEHAAWYARGKFTVGAEGRYGFRTVKPVSYSIPTDGPVGQMLNAMGRPPYRPAHLHAIVSAPGYAPVTTHLFVEGDPHLDSDAVFAVKQSLIIKFDTRPPGPTPDQKTSPVAFCTASYDFTLVRLGPAGGQEA